MKKVYRIRLVKRKDGDSTKVEFLHSPWAKHVSADEHTRVLAEWRLLCRKEFLRPFLQRLKKDFIDEGDLFTVVCAPSLECFIH